jgi:hypothetical protein
MSSLSRKITRKIKAVEEKSSTAGISGTGGMGKKIKNRTSYFTRILSRRFLSNARIA